MHKTKQQILDAAILCARIDGYQNIRRESIAQALGIACGTINFHYSTMSKLKRAVMRAAVEQRIAPLVAQGLAARDSQALKADEDLKVLARQSL